MHASISAHVPGICSFCVCPNCVSSSWEDEGEPPSELVCLCWPFEASSAPVPAIDCDCHWFRLPLIDVIWPAYRSQMSQFDSCLWTFALVIPSPGTPPSHHFDSHSLFTFIYLSLCSIQSPILDSNISWNWLLSDFNYKFKRISFKAAVTRGLLFLSKLVTTGQGW